MKLYALTTFADGANRPDDLISVALTNEKGDDFYKVVDWECTRMKVFIIRGVIPVLGVEGTPKQRVKRPALAKAFKEYILAQGVDSFDIYVTNLKNYKNIKRLFEAAGLNRIKHKPVLVYGDYRNLSEIPFNALADVKAIKLGLKTDQLSTTSVGLDKTPEVFMSMDYKMTQEAVYGDHWVIRRHNGELVDHGKDREDLMELYKIKELVD